MALSGTSVILRFCEVDHSLTGSNVKSRAHHTRVEYCYVHHSANREFDLVDGAETARPQSDAVLLGNVIIKDPRCTGNRAVVHFGQDGGRGHNGTLHLAFNTIVTPFVAPVVELSAAGAKVQMLGNVICSGAVQQARQKLTEARAGAAIQNVSGQWNWFWGDFSGQGTQLDAATNHFAPMREDLFLSSRGDNFRLTPQAAQRMTGASTAALIELPPVPGLPSTAELRPLDWQYHHSAGGERRPKEDSVTAGAYARPAGRR